MSIDFDEGQAKTTSAMELTPLIQNWRLRNIMLPGAVILLIALGWYIVLRQIEILTQTSITTYQQSRFANRIASASCAWLKMRTAVEAPGALLGGIGRRWAGQYLLLDPAG